MAELERDDIPHGICPALPLLDHKMTTYLALLRGINVGGYRPLKMEELRKMFTLMGFKNVSTYIQSGNVLFDAEQNQDNQLALKLHHQITKTFEYDVPVFVRELSLIEEIHGGFPFEEREGWTGYVTFLQQEPSPKQIKMLLEINSDFEQVQVKRREIFSHVDKKTSEKPVFSNSFIEKK
ncbi:MAG TPA: DUF1697 domain-containing protein, partial [Balneolaceae bacterium]|nr:DUF1697 domain-containing protein [Balneolaceae bacterium]